MSGNVNEREGLAINCSFQVSVKNTSPRYLRNLRNKYKRQ